MAALKVFFDSFSQPSRAVLLLLHANKIPYQPCMIKIAQGEVKTIDSCVWGGGEGRERERRIMLSSFTPLSLWFHAGETRTREDFMKVSPTQKVPAIDDNGFCLFER